MKRRSRSAFAAVAAALIVGTITVLAPPAYAVTQTWIGQATGAGAGLWSAAGNWSGAVPVVGDDVVFPANLVSLATRTTTNDLGAGVNLTSVTFDGAGYTVSGSPINAAAVTVTGAFATTISGITTSLVGATTTVNVGAGGTLTSGAVTGGLNLAKTGQGVLVLTGANTYTGATAINGGALLVNGSSTNSTHNLVAGVLGGVGTVGPLTATGGAVSPGQGGPGALIVNGALVLTAGSSYSVDIAGAAAGSGYDVLLAPSVTLGGGQLVVSSAFTGAANQTFTIIDNTGPSPVQGTFANLPEGATVTASGGQVYRISYRGGTGGNDVVLTQGTGGGKTAVVLAGVDRVDTAVKISQNSFPANGSAQAVVLARGDIFPDALAGSPLAVARGGPLLLTSISGPSTALDSRTVAEIQRVLPTGRTIFVLGGTAAIADSVLQQLTSLGYSVPRQFAGTDRYQTSLLIAQTGLNNPTNLVLATGNNFPDALSAGAAAAKLQGAVLLTNNNVMPPNTASYLASRTGITQYAIGGPASQAAPSAIPIFGSDRYATAVLVAQRFFPSPTAIGITSGETFPDGLTGGAHIGKLGGPLVLTVPTSLPSVVQSYLQGVKASVTQLFVYGGSAAVSASTVSQINSAVA